EVRYQPLLPAQEPFFGSEPKVRQDMAKVWVGGCCCPHAPASNANRRCVAGCRIWKSSRQDYHLHVHIRLGVVGGVDRPYLFSRGYRYRLLQTLGLIVW